jgi:hypothetical protein
MVSKALERNASTLSAAGWSPAGKSLRSGSNALQRVSRDGFQEGDGLFFG